MSLEIPPLPEPDAAARAHSARLVAVIRAELERSDGRIPFARYMELTLHAPGLGYYSAGSVKLGEAGDFVTAPEISPLFAFCLARQCRAVLQALPAGGEILEFGAGTGALACDLLRELERLDSLPARYVILELSADLRARQRALLRERIPHLFGRVDWIAHLPGAPVSGVILANEVVDAMPVHRLVKQEDWRELYVAWREGDGFVYEPGPLSDDRLRRRLRSIVAGAEESFAEGHVLEINLAADGWLAAVGGILAQGVILLADYGRPRAEYYHPDRTAGTLRCFYRHRVHDDALALTGLQDITADVEFTALAEAAVAAGLTVAGYTSQAYFLLGGGLMEWEQRLQQADTRERMRLAQQIRSLTLPGEMGERFKVMALARGADAALSGFALRDERGRL